MAAYTWIKLYHEILDDPKMGKLSNHLWRRAVELFLLAGREGNDGALPPVEEMAWTLRLEKDKLLEDLHGLAEVGVVHEAEPGNWVVTHFAKRQTALTSTERVQQFRKRKGNEDETSRYRLGNENETGDGYDSLSSSTPPSDSVSSSEGGGAGEETEPPAKTEPSDWIPAEQTAQLEAFTGRFGKFHGRDEIDRYLALIEKHGMEKLTEVMDWAAKKEAHLTNRGALLDTLETAAEGWTRRGPKYPNKNDSKAFLEALERA